MSGQRNTPDTLATLKKLHDNNDRRWKALCLKLCRAARNLPAVYPSAFAAQHATPMSDRVYDLSKLVEGMVVYFDDPNDSNKWGHIATLRTRQGKGLLTWTNDALRSGGVDSVPLDWFQRNWGDKFQFGATSLNGFDLILPNPVPRVKPSNKPPAPATPKASKGNLDYAVHRIEKAIIHHNNAGHPRIVKALRGERQDLINIQKGKFK